MPIFISYSHQDKEFVDRLATQLVAHKVNVWLDRWEMQIGESLIDRIQEAITDASALLVILSPSSVESSWCKKELNSGLIRELEERRIIVLPVLIADCRIPIFLREKMYADFRTDFDSGLTMILESIAKVTNEWRNRLDEPTWHTDWSIDWFTSDEGVHLLRLTLVEVAESQPYTALSVISLIPINPQTNDSYSKMVTQGLEAEAQQHVVESLSEELTRIDHRVLLEDQFEKTNQIFFETDYGEFHANISTRLLGSDTGRDVLFNTAGQINGIKKQMQDSVAKPPINKS